LVLSERNVVIDAEGLDARGESLLAGLDVTNKELADALHIIASALHEAGLLGPEQWIVMALHPIGDRLGAAELTALADATRQILDTHLAEQGLPPVEVKIVVLTAELADETHAAGLLPADYVDDYIEAQAYMTEAGITTDNASAILKAAFTDDPSLEELTTITAAMIDLVEEGLSPEEALAKIQDAIQADPTLEKFDDLIEIPEEEDDEVEAETEEEDDEVEDEEVEDEELSIDYSMTL
jgi:DNA-binding phage protein